MRGLPKVATLLSIGAVAAAAAVPTASADQTCGNDGILYGPTGTYIFNSSDPEQVKADRDGDNYVCHYYTGSSKKQKASRWGDDR